MLFPHAGLSLEERDSLLDRAAAEVARRRLEVPAVFALEMHRPMVFLGSQALAVFTPFLAPAFGLESLQKLYGLMEDRDNLDRLIHRIEDLAARRDAEAQPCAEGAGE